MKKLFAAALVAAVSMSAQAEVGDTTLSLGGSLTQGVGGEIGYQVTDSVAIRGAYYSASMSESDTVDGINYAMDLDVQNTGLFVDWKPSLDSGFRVTAGAIQNGNGFTATASPAASYDIGGTTYTPSEVGTLTASVGFDNVAPYVGVGYDWGLTDNLSIGFEGGVIMQGKPKVSMSTTGTLAADAGFQSSLEAERAAAEKDMESFQYMPVAKLALKYTF